MTEENHKILFAYIVPHLGFDLYVLSRGCTGDLVVLLICTDAWKDKWIVLVLNVNMSEGVSPCPISTPHTC